MRPILKFQFQITPPHPTVFQNWRISVRNSSSAVNLSYSLVSPPPSGAGSETPPPFLITHGLLGSKSNWNSIAKAVSKATSRQVITFDARNHGDSPQSEEHSYNLMAEDIYQLSRTLGFEKFSLMGHSMGGRTAMVAALRNPALLEKVVVVDVSPVSLQSRFHSEMKGYIRTMMGTNFNLERKVTLSEARKIGNEALMPLVPEASIRAFLLTNLAEGPEGIVWKPNLPILLKSVDSIGEFPKDLSNSKYPSKALFIRGEKSSYVPDKDWPQIQKLFPSSKLVTIQGSGHWPHADNVNDFLGALVPFLLY